MNARSRLFLWEQARLCLWMLAGVLAAVLSCAMASLLRSIPEDADLAKAAGGIYPLLFHMLGYISTKDAKELADGYSQLAILVILFGALLPSNTVIQLDLPARLLRLPVNSGWLSRGWVGARTAIVFAAIAVIVATRQIFYNVETELVPIPAFVYYGSGFMLLQGVVRLVAAWKESAAWVALVLTASLLGFLAGPLWSLAKYAPLPVLLTCAAVGLPLAVAGFVLRRRGGIIVAAELPKTLRREAVYGRVSEIPRFADDVSAHTWMEWRRHGRYFPALCVIGCFIALGAALMPGEHVYRGQTELHGWEKYTYALAHLDMIWLVGYLLTVPLYASLLFGVYLSVMDVTGAPKSTARFTMVRPLGGWTFARARLRMLGGSLSRGMLCLPIVFVFASLVYRPGGEFVHDLSEALFAGHYTMQGMIMSGRGADVLASGLFYGVCIAMLLTAMNRFVVLLLIISLVFEMSTNAFKGISDPLSQDYSLGLFVFAPIFLLAVTLGTAAYTGLLRVRTLTWICLGWLAAECLYMVLGNGSWLLNIVSIQVFTPIASGLAVISIALPAWALAHHGRRSGSWMPPRMAGARADWGEASGVLRALAVVLVVVAALVGVWRAAAGKELDAAMANAARLGIAPDSPPQSIEDNARIMSDPEWTSLVAAQQPLRATFDLDSRKIWCEGHNVKFEGVGGALIPDDSSPMLAADAAVLAALRPDLEAVVKASKPLIDGARINKASTKNGDEVENLDINAYAMSLVAALDGAEAGDREEAFRGLQSAGALLHEFAKTPGIAALVLREYGAEDYLFVLSRVTARMALTAEQCAALRDVLPGTTTLPQLAGALRLPAEKDYLDADNFYGYDFNLSGGEYLVAIRISNFLRVLDITYANLAEKADETMTAHRDCLEGKSFAMRVDTRRRDRLFMSSGFGAYAVAHRGVHRFDAMIELTRAALGLEEYRARHGAYPDSLKNLVPEILAAVPVDWTDPRKDQKDCKYTRSSPQSFKAYVCGADGVDNDGVPQFGDKQRGGDIVFRVNRP